MIAKALANLALVEMELGKLDQAEEWQREALATVREKKDPFLEGSAHFHLAQVLQRAGKTDEARKSNAELLRIGRELESSRLLMRAHLNAARLAMAEKRYADAVASARAAIERVAESTAGLAAGEGTQARDYRAEVFELGTRAALLGGDPRTLCHMLEVGRAGALLEALGGRDALTDVVVPDALREEWEAARALETQAAHRLYVPFNLAPGPRGGLRRVGNDLPAPPGRPGRARRPRARARRQLWGLAE